MFVRQNVLTQKLRHCPQYLNLLFYKIQSAGSRGEKDKAKQEAYKLVASAIKGFMDGHYNFDDIDECVVCGIFG